MKIKYKLSIELVLSGYSKVKIKVTLKYKK